MIGLMMVVLLSYSHYLIIIVNTLFEIGKNLNNCKNFKV